MSLGHALNVSTTQFSLCPLDDPKDFWARVENLCRRAHAEFSTVLCLPEYFSASWILSLYESGSFRDRLCGLTAEMDQFLAPMRALSDQYTLCIIAGTVPIVVEGSLRNRSYVFRPRQPAIHQDKLHMTRFEAEEWRVSPGPRQLHCFDWMGTTCAVAICYDIEFPQVSMALAEAGVQVVMVPSCTEAAHGYWRVRHTAEARCIEGQMFAVMSSIVGGHPKYSEIDVHHGQGVILSPCDGRFPADGVLMSGDINREGLVSARLDLAELATIRKSGAVLNLRDNVGGKEPVKVLMEA